MREEQSNGEHSHMMAGSERPRPDTHKLIGPVSADEPIAVTLVIRRKPGAPPLPDLDYWRNTPLREQRILTPAQYAEIYGAHPGDLAKVEAFFTSRGMTVRDSHAGRRTMTVHGTAVKINELFGIVLNHYEAPVQEHPTHRPEQAVRFEVARTQRHRGFDGRVRLPNELAGVVTAVVGLDNRSAGGPAGSASGDPTNSNSLYVPQLAGYYNFPNLKVPDQTVSVIAPSDPPTVTNPRLSGYLQTDITDLYFPQLATTYPNYGTAPASFHDIGLTVGSNSYTNSTASAQAANNFSQEVTQDISTSATIAQGCTMNVYFTELSENGLLVALNRILLPEGENQPTVVTCSFNFFGADSGLGSPTDSSSAAFLMSEQFQQLAVVGVNCFMISQDFGSSGGDSDGNPHVVYPGSDPWVTSCGGTVVGNVQTSPSFSYDESTWSNVGLASAVGGFNGATGGGASETFPIPSYQSAFGLASITDSAGNVHSNRFVPDIAGMVSLTGFYLSGSYLGDFTGTSCVAPLYAGLFAVLRSALGRSLGFLNPILYQLSSTFHDVTTGNNFPTDKTAPYYTSGAGWDACTGLGHVDGTKLLNGIAGLFYNPNFYFELNKGSFGLDEVSITPSYGGPSYPMWLVLEGFTPQAVMAAGLTPAVSADLPGVTVSVGTAQFELSSEQQTPQRTLFPCTITFAKSAIAPASSPQGIFPVPGNPPTPTPVNLSSEIKIAGKFLAALTQLELEPGDDPFFSNFDTAGTNPFYLSNDLRVFTLTPGLSGTSIVGEPKLSPSNNTHFDTGAGYRYIQGLLTYLNEHYSVPSNTDPFTKFPDQTNALSGDSSVTPTSINPANPTGTPFTNYNFAVARVRLNGAEGSSGPNVRALFRLFAAETGDTDYQASTYPSTSDSEGQPLAPLLGTDNVTIPFFATGNYESNSDFQANVDYSANSINNQPVSIPAGGIVWAYYGCYLNIYPTSNTITTSGRKVAVQSLLPSSHSCVVAQLVYDNAPMPGTGVLQGPEWTTNFAQRNLEITYSDNPGPLATHRVPQTFDARPSGPLGTGNLFDYPDELMIDWGSTPVGSTANIYWPQVKSADVLALAGKVYSTHQLSPADANTVQCTVPHGFTFVPIPPGTGQNYAGLFTVDLPKGVKAGQKFTITVRRVSTRQGIFKQPPPQTEQPKLLLSGRDTADPVTVARNWRYVVGTFAVEIPVTTPKVMLRPEENTLAILKWRLDQMEPANRWVPVLKRYIGYIEGRVNGLGGNASTIQPSPWGANGAPGNIERHPVPKPEEFTGKIAGLIYDHFGDFEGFVLETAECETKRFCSRETKMEILIRDLWRERSVVTVVVKDKGSCCVSAVVAGAWSPCCEEKRALLSRLR